jgi:hypothetical protein
VLERQYELGCGGVGDWRVESEEEVESKPTGGRTDSDSARCRPHV